MDVQSKQTRSYNMSCIKGKKTKPEEIVAKYLFSKGFRYRRNVKKLPGTPDIVLKKYNTVIFINGCFWHMHNCRYFVWPQSNAEFWKEKLMANKQRDEKIQNQLEELGWIVITVWECQLKNEKERTLDDLVNEIKKSAI
ncbi:MAG: very short patch repair endonuclease [Clostridia bacterium]|nr:very short patch repair endonuclease [Clostridia bacterium]